MAERLTMDRRSLHLVLTSKVTTSYLEGLIKKQCFKLIAGPDVESSVEKKIKVGYFNEN